MFANLKGIFRNGSMILILFDFVFHFSLLDHVKTARMLIHIYSGIKIGTMRKKDEYIQDVDHKKVVESSLFLWPSENCICNANSMLRIALFDDVFQI